MISKVDLSLDFPMACPVWFQNYHLLCPPQRFSVSLRQGPASRVSSRSSPGYSTVRSGLNTGRTQGAFLWTGYKVWATVKAPCSGGLLCFFVAESQHNPYSLRCSKLVGNPTTQEHPKIKEGTLTRWPPCRNSRRAQKQ